MRNHQKLFLLVLCTPLATATCFMEPVNTGSTHVAVPFDPNNPANLSNVILPGDRDIFTDLDETQSVATACDKTSADAHNILQHNCAGCHNIGPASSGNPPFDFVMNDDLLMANTWNQEGQAPAHFVVKGDPDNSLIYQRAAIKRNMPPLQADPSQPFYPRIDYSAASVLRDWITSCIGTDTGGGTGGAGGSGGTVVTGAAGNSGGGGSTGAAGSGGGGNGAAGQSGGGGAAGGGAGGGAAGAGGRGGMGGTAGMGAAGAAGTNGDNTKYNFENGVQGWAATARVGLGTLTQVTTNQTMVFAGIRSLRASFTAPTGMTTYEMSVMNPTPTIPAGAAITFHYFVPTGAQIGFVQPFVTDSTAGSFINNFITNPTMGSWQTATVNVPANANLPITNMGFQFGTTGAFTGSVFIDSINW